MDSELVARGCLFFAGGLGCLDRATLLHLVEETLAGEGPHAYWRGLSSTGHGGIEACQAEFCDQIIGSLSPGEPGLEAGDQGEADRHQYCLGQSQRTIWHQGLGGGADLQLSIHHLQVFQRVENILGHSFGQVDKTVRFKNLNATDRPALKP